MWRGGGEGLGGLRVVVLRGKECEEKMMSDECFEEGGRRMRN